MKKGFTLVELLATIIILGLLSLLIIPPVLKTIDQAKDEAYNRMHNNIENATLLYINNNKEDITNINVVGSDIQITLQDLVNEGILKEPIKNPKTKDTIPLTTTITIHVVKKNNYDITFNYDGS